MDGVMEYRASQNSAVLVISRVDGILISMMSKVRAIAKTPSQKVSKRVLGFSKINFSKYSCFFCSPAFSNGPCRFLSPALRSLKDTL